VDTKGVGKTSRDNDRLAAFAEDGRLAFFDERLGKAENGAIRRLLNRGTFQTARVDGLQEVPILASQKELANGARVGVADDGRATDHLRAKAHGQPGLLGRGEFNRDGVFHRVGDLTEFHVKGKLLAAAEGTVQDRGDGRLLLRNGVAVQHASVGHGGQHDAWLVVELFVGWFTYLLECCKCGLWQSNFVRSILLFFCEPQKFGNLWLLPWFIRRTFFWNDSPRLSSDASPYSEDRYRQHKHLSAESTVPVGWHDCRRRLFDEFLLMNRPLCPCDCLERSLSQRQDPMVISSSQQEANF
jgi:hypothetical protein